MPFDWKATIGSVVPTLAGILTCNPVAGVAVGALCKALGMEPSKENAQKVAEDFASGQLSGDQLVALKKAEAEAIAQLKKMDLDFDLEEDKIVASDRASARSREISVRDRTPAIGFYLITAGFFGLLGLLLFHNVPESNKPVLYTMVGSLGTAWVGAVQYYYGSTKGDTDKTKMLYESTPPQK